MQLVFGVTVTIFARFLMQVQLHSHLNTYVRHETIVDLAQLSSAPTTTVAGPKSQLKGLIWLNCPLEVEMVLFTAKLLACRCSRISCRKKI